MRRISVHAVAFALAASLALAGCARTAPIHNIQDSQVAPNSGKPLAAAQVRGAIITFKSEQNLNAANGTIHSNYNGWVENLDRAIRTEISRL